MCEKNPYTGSKDTGFKIQASRYRLQDTGFKIQISKYRLEGGRLGRYRPYDTGFRYLGFSKLVHSNFSIEGLKTFSGNAASKGGSAN